MEVLVHWLYNLISKNWWLTLCIPGIKGLVNWRSVSYKLSNKNCQTLLLPTIDPYTYVQSMYVAKLLPFVSFCSHSINGWLLDNTWRNCVCLLLLSIHFNDSTLHTSTSLKFFSVRSLWLNTCNKPNTYKQTQNYSYVYQSMYQKNYVAVIDQSY